MHSKAIREWLAEYKVLSKEEVHSYAASIRHNGELITSLYSLFDEHPDPETLDPVCHQLFEFYRSRELELQKFSLELIPSLIWLYLSFISRGEKSKCGGVEAFLLAVYNLETCNPDGSPKVKTIRLPAFSKHSIYHEPQQLSSSPHLEAYLSRLNAEQSVHQEGPRPQYESINGQNRHAVLAYLLQCYHRNISNLSSRSYRVMCKMCSRIVTTGFHTLVPDNEEELRDAVQSTATLTRQTRASGELDPRIHITSALLIDMLTCLYYIMFNGNAEDGAQAIVDIHYRASFELLPDVLLVTNAVRNSLRENPSGQPDAGPIGLSLTLTPASSGYTLSKTAITNASFRAKKLPEDIPVMPDDTGKLPTISEDDSAAKVKTPKVKQTKKEKAAEKSRAKEQQRSNANMNNSNLTNGDTSIDSVQVVVTRGSQQRTTVDALELTNFTKTKDLETNSSPHPSKQPSPALKSNSAMKSSISNKDIKNTKMASGHTRNHSGGSAGSETYSTDL